MDYERIGSVRYTIEVLQKIETSRIRGRECKSGQRKQAWIAVVVAGTRRCPM